MCYLHDEHTNLDDFRRRDTRRETKLELERVQVSKLELERVLVSAHLS
jgi:hypothetical protein